MRGGKVRYICITLLTAFLLEKYINGSYGSKSTSSLTDLINIQNLTYNKDILPIIEKRCAMCHNKTTLDRNWLDYNTTYKKRANIKLRLENRTMPIGITMPDNERKLMIDWVKQGAKK
jgi:uncharacterized membrane protein